MGCTCALCGLAFYLCRLTGLVGQAASSHSLPTVSGCRPREYQSSKLSTLLLFLAPQQGKCQTQLAASLAQGPPQSWGQQSAAIVRPCVLCSLPSSIHSAVAAGAPWPQHPQVSLTGVWTGPQLDFSEFQRVQRGQQRLWPQCGRGSRICTLSAISKFISALSQLHWLSKYNQAKVQTVVYSFCVT